MAEPVTSPELLLWALIIVVGSKEIRRWCTKRDHEKEDIAKLIRRDKPTHNRGVMMAKKKGGKGRPRPKPTKGPGY